MSQVVPLISAAALVPPLQWLAANGHGIEARLEAADLGYFPADRPDRPIPLLNAVEFMRAAARAEGPDFGCRVIDATSVSRLARLGRVALGARTPREALGRIAAALPRHCTHERIALAAAPDGLVVREVMALPLDAEALHVVQQYVAAMVKSLCAMTAAPEPHFSRVEIAPHPEFGLDHLRPWLGPDIAPATSRALVLAMPRKVADLGFRRVARDRMGDDAGGEWPELRGDGRFAPSARIVVAAMLAGGAPTLERLAAAAGTSVRTLQRRLADDGAAFSSIVDEARREAAVAEIGRGRRPMGEIAASLGYARQSALTRAVRRWTGAPPSRMRRPG